MLLFHVPNPVAETSNLPAVAIIQPLLSITWRSPASTSVKVGTVVKWYNKDGYAHTVTSDDGTSFNSGNLAGGATFSYTAATVGSFAYHCNIHSNMHGTLVVTQ